MPPERATDEGPLVSRPRRVRAYVGLGSNLGDPETTLAAAVPAIGALPGVRLVGVSRLYATRPVGVVDQPEFRNACVALDVTVPDAPATAAVRLLARLKELERTAGRRRGRRWGPRPLDLDLLVFGRHPIRIERPPDARTSDPTADPEVARWLVVPHPEAQRRRFVLEPLADLAPSLRPPGWAETVATAARRQHGVEGPDAVRPIGSWDVELSRWRPLPPGPES